MFYVFHHMPKCGGTSFRRFLESMFTVHSDYHVGNNASHPEKFRHYMNTPISLGKLTHENCIAGHYNIDGIRLWQRYPSLDNYNHRKFSILREPLDTAISGLKFGIKRGWYDAHMSTEVKERLLLSRASYFSDTLGIKTKVDAEGIMDKYWFIAPLTQIDLAAKAIAMELGKKFRPVEKVNTTESQDNFIDLELKQKFEEKASLDRYIYKLCVMRFKNFCAERSI